MATRPLSLTILGWLMAISAVTGLYNLSVIEANLARVEAIKAAGMTVLSYRLTTGSAYVLLPLCAYGVLGGLPFARLLYMALLALLSLVAVLLSGAATATIGGGLVLGLVMAFLLFGPEANEWFDAKGLQLIRNDAR